MRSVRVTLNDRTETRDVRVAAREDNPARFDLTPDQTLPPPPAPDPTAHIIGGIAVGAAGLVALGVGIGSFAAGSCTLVLDGGVCASGSPTDEPAAIAWTVAGAALLTGGVIWLAVGLASGSDGGAAQQARIEAGFGLGSVALRGRF